MGDDDLFTSITVDSSWGHPSLTYRTLDYSNSIQQHYNNDLCNINSVNAEIDEESWKESWKEVHKIIKQQEKEDEKRELIENFRELTKILWERL